MTNYIKYINPSAIILLVLVNTSCNSPVPMVEWENDLNARSEMQPGDTIYAGDRDTVILLKNGEAFLKGRMGKGKNTRKYTIPTWQGQRVTAYLTPETKAGNIRISHVDIPGVETKGPLGDSLNLVMKNSGNLRLTIGGNSTAGKPYNGNFVLHVIVK